MEKTYAAVAFLTLLAGPAAAGGPASLPPGNAAGVRQAQDAGKSIARRAVIADIVVLASDNNNAPAPSPATSTATTST